MKFILFSIFYFLILIFLNNLKKMEKLELHFNW